MNDPTARDTAELSDKPRAIIHPDDDSVSIVFRGDCVVLFGIDIMREIRDSLTNHILYLEADRDKWTNVQSISIRVRSLMNVGRDYETALNMAIDEVTAAGKYVRCDRCTTPTAGPIRSPHPKENVICSVCASPVGWDGVISE